MKLNFWQLLGLLLLVAGVAFWGYRKLTGVDPTSPATTRQTVGG